jgi:hypothetical protein
MLKTPTWYSLPLDIFVKFLYKVILRHLPFPLRAHKHVFIFAILPSKDSDIYGLMSFSSSFMSFIFIKSPQACVHTCHLTLQRR